MKPLTTYRGIDIRISPDGIFHACVDTIDLHCEVLYKIQMEIQLILCNKYLKENPIEVIKIGSEKTPRKISKLVKEYGNENEIGLYELSNTTLITSENAQEVYEYLALREQINQLEKRKNGIYNKISKQTFNIDKFLDKYHNE